MIKLTNNKYRGVEGYVHTETVSIFDIIARGILVSNIDILALETCMKFNNIFTINEFKMEAA